MRVKAVRAGYYGNIYREPGSEFEIADDEKPGSWMESLEPAKKGGKKGPKDDTPPPPPPPPPPPGEGDGGKSNPPDGGDGAI